MFSLGGKADKSRMSINPDRRLVSISASQKREKKKIPNFYDSEVASESEPSTQVTTTNDMGLGIGINNTDSDDLIQSSRGELPQDRMSYKIKVVKNISDSSTCILDREAIKKRIQGGHIFIHPFSEESLRKCHIALTLGDSYFTQNREVEYITPSDELQLRKLWAGPYKASEFGKDKRKAKYIIIEPHTSILVHSAETLGVFYSVCASFNLCPKIILCGLTSEISPFFVGNIDKVTVLLTNNTYNRVTLEVGTIFMYCTLMLTNYTPNTGLNMEDSLEFSRNWSFDSIFPSVGNQMYDADVQTANVKEFTGFGRKQRK